MSYEFTKLADVPALEEVPEGANALIEVDGAIRRVPGDGLGGGGGIPTAIIRLNMDSASDASIASLADLTGGTAAVAAGGSARASSSETIIYAATCDNMTRAEAEAILRAGEVLGATVTIGATTDECAFYEVIASTNLGIAEIGETAVIGFMFYSNVLHFLSDNGQVTLYWLEDGTLTSDMSALNPS